MIDRVALLSLEPWDDVWRRNQHLAAGVVANGSVRELVFVTPPEGGLATRSQTSSPIEGITVVTPPLVVPRRRGGHRVLASWLRRRLDGIDVLWINDPVAGEGVLSADVPAVYDITDDWRSMPQDETERARIIAAEDALATAAHTVVCSAELWDRWRRRYDVDATLIPNGVDVAAIAAASEQTPPPTGKVPHAVYVGTLHANRLDVELVASLARSGIAVDLVGPDHLDDASRAALRDAGVIPFGAIASSEVPSWLVTADVLICPHLVDEFTRSLDAIKAHEYLATTRPVVATPSSGFQSLSAPGLTVTSGNAFFVAVHDAVGTGPFTRVAPASWSHRADEFAAVLRSAVA